METMTGTSSASLRGPDVECQAVLDLSRQLHAEIWLRSLGKALIGVPDAVPNSVAIATVCGGVLNRYCGIWGSFDRCQALISGIIIR
jgi:hypothetical protein